MRNTQSLRRRARSHPQIYLLCTDHPPPCRLKKFYFLRRRSSTLILFSPPIPFLSTSAATRHTGQGIPQGFPITFPPLPSQYGICPLPQPPPRTLFGSSHGPQSSIVWLGPQPAIILHPSFTQEKPRAIFEFLCFFFLTKPSLVSNSALGRFLSPSSLSCPGFASRLRVKSSRYPVVAPLVPFRCLVTNLTSLLLVFYLHLPFRFAIRQIASFQYPFTVSASPIS